MTEARRLALFLTVAVFAGAAMIAASSDAQLQVRSDTLIRTD